MQTPERLIYDHARRRHQFARRLKSTDPFLWRGVQQDLLARLSLVKPAFSRVLVYGTADPQFSQEVADVTQAQDLSVGLPCFHPHATCIYHEDALPFEAESFDLILSMHTLHTCNHQAMALFQYRACLRPGGLFLGSVFGPGTALALKSAALEFEAHTTNSLSPRFAPLTDGATYAHLLQQAGFQLPVVDADRVLVDYPTLMRLAQDIRDLGERTCLTDRSRQPLTRSFLQDFEADLQKTEKCVTIPFEHLYLTGWA